MGRLYILVDFCGFHVYGKYTSPIESYVFFRKLEDWKGKFG